MASITSCADPNDNEEPLKAETLSKIDYSSVALGLFIGVIEYIEFT